MEDARSLARHRVQKAQWLLCALRRPVRRVLRDGLSGFSRRRLPSRNLPRRSLPTTPAPRNGSQKALALALSSFWRSQQRSRLQQAFSILRDARLDETRTSLLESLAGESQDSRIVSTGNSQSDQLLLAQRLRSRLHRELRVCKPLHAALLVSAAAITRQLSCGMDALRLHAARTRRAERESSACSPLEGCNEGSLVHVMAASAVLRVLCRRRLGAAWRQWLSVSAWDEALDEGSQAMRISEIACSALAAFHAVADPDFRKCKLPGDSYTESLWEMQGADVEKNDASQSSMHLPTFGTLAPEIIRFDDSTKIELEHSSSRDINGYPLSVARMRKSSPAEEIVVGRGVPGVSDALRSVPLATFGTDTVIPSSLPTSPELWQQSQGTPESPAESVVSVGPRKWHVQGSGFVVTDITSAVHAAGGHQPSRDMSALTSACQGVALNSLVSRLDHVVQKQQRAALRHWERHGSGHYQSVWPGLETETGPTTARHAERMQHRLAASSPQSLVTATGTERSRFNHPDVNYVISESIRDRVPDTHQAPYYEGIVRDTRPHRERLLLQRTDQPQAFSTPSFSAAPQYGSLTSRDHVRTPQRARRSSVQVEVETLRPSPSPHSGAYTGPVELIGDSSRFPIGGNGSIPEFMQNHHAVDVQGGGRSAYPSYPGMIAQQPSENYGVAWSNVHTAIPPPSMPEFLTYSSLQRMPPTLEHNRAPDVWCGN